MLNKFSIVCFVLFFFCCMAEETIYLFFGCGLLKFPNFLPSGLGKKVQMQHQAKMMFVFCHHLQVFHNYQL